MTSRPSEAGNVLFYIFLAVGLLAALTYVFAKNSRESYVVQGAASLAENLYVQVNTIKGAIQQCATEFPDFGDASGSPCGAFKCGDLNHDNVIDSTDDPNMPYPLKPSSALNANAQAGCTTTSNAAGCISAAADDNVRSLMCTGAPIGQTNIFQGTGNQGRFLPPPPSGFPEWTYKNDANGVYIQIIAPGDGGSTNAINRLITKFANCQADLNYNGCGANCFTAWILRNACP